MLLIENSKFLIYKKVDFVLLDFGKVKMINGFLLKK